MKKLLIITTFFLLNLKSFASDADLFFYDENYIKISFSQLTQLENKIENNTVTELELEKFRLENFILVSPDGDAKSAGDSFFKGFFLGCFGVIDAYLEDDRNKYKRGPLWTGCCLNTLVLAGVYYLLDINYFHLVPEK